DDRADLLLDRCGQGSADLDREVVRTGGSSTEDPVHAHERDPEEHPAASTGRDLDLVADEEADGVLDPARRALVPIDTEQDPNQAALVDQREVFECKGIPEIPEHKVYERLGRDVGIEDVREVIDVIQEQKEWLLQHRKEPAEVAGIVFAEVQGGDELR